MDIGLSLGSNLGDRMATLREAAGRIARIPGIRIRAAAPVYETEPVDTKPEYANLKYLNTVLIVETRTEITLTKLARNLHGIEDQLGRIRQEDRNAPRTLDIDILFAGSIMQSDDILDLPHPRWAARRFVVQPLADVCPHLVLPGESRSVSTILAALPPGGIVKVFDHDWLPQNLINGGSVHAV